MNVPDLLDEIADEVSLPDNWLQKSLGDWNQEAGPVCAMGGIYRILLRHGIGIGAQESFYGPIGIYILEHPDEYIDSTHMKLRIGLASQLVEYNNAPGRTAGEVADLFRTVAKHLREET